jgi:prevent-host-death family protein
MPRVPVFKAKAILSELIRQAEAGEEVVITRDDAPVVVLRPVTQKGQRRFGSMKGRVFVGDEFFEPLPESELKLWSGES